MLNKSVIRYEHQKLIIGEDGFRDSHWRAFLKLNSLHNDKYFKILHNGIQFNEHVGILQIDNFCVEIHPKADKYENDGNWKNILVPMLKACGKISPNSIGPAQVKRQNFNLLEVYFDLFLNEVQNLIRLGLIKKYRKKTKNINALKGKLEFSGHIRKNLIHREQFYTTHQVYNKDHLIHQILNEALLIIHRFGQKSYLRGKISSILISFPKVQRIKITRSTFKNLVLNRKSKPYSYAIELARLIILNYSPDVSFGREKMLSLLFDMNTLWERFISVQLRNYISENESDWEVFEQESKLFIKKHSLRPDIVLTNRKTNEAIVIDTKWKLGEEYVGIDDLRQVYTYSRYWNAEKVMLLYPGKTSGTNFENYQNIYDQKRHKCKLGFIDIFDNYGNLSNNIGELVFSLIEA